MSFVVSCTCGKQFRVADESRGKRSKCKGCGTTLLLEPDADSAPAPPPPAPAPAYSMGGGDEGDDPFANIDWDAAAKMEQSATPRQGNPPPLRMGGGPPPPPQAAPAANKRPCPSCGSMISAFAIKCEFCGAGLTAGAAAAGGRGAGKPMKPVYATPSDDDSDLTAMDWVICILCSGIGCILGIVYLVQGKKKGIKMIGISFLVGMITGGIKSYLRQQALQSP